ncbi:uncharacterized protein [Ranitomeya imitator]|uniref:uncharacterized protein n=1 Tax=Ranitomeya imitator TaxID=111125 RepID=UPI0037E87D4C
MDFRALDCTWRAQINDVCLDNADGVVEGSSKELQEVVHRFKELLRKRTRTWWNHEFLDMYIQKDLIPRGLRIQVFPSFPILDDKFKNDWEELTNTCSRGFMVLLKRLNHESLEVIEKEIDELQVCLQKDMSSDALKKLNEEIDADLQKWAHDIQTTKTKKFNRDILDKQQSRVYRWRNPWGRSRPRSRNMSYSRSRSTSAFSGRSNHEEDARSSTSQSEQVSMSESGNKRMTTRQHTRNKGAGGTTARGGRQGGLQP